MRRKRRWRATAEALKGSRPVTASISGTVAEKFERDGKGYARVKVECVNHRDELTAAGAAEVELPKRAG